MILYLFILLNLLCLWPPFCRLEGHSSLLWNLPLVGGIGPAPCEGFLAWQLAAVFCWLELGFVPLKGSAMSSSVFWDTRGFGQLVF